MFGYDPNRDELEVLHVEWNLRKTTFNNLTPPKVPFLGGGGSIFWIISWIFGSGPTKKSDKNLEQAGTFNVLIGRFRPIYGFLKSKKSEYFWANLATFFFKIGFWAKLVLEVLKMGFLRLFRSRSWFISIFDRVFTF
jgi:hypothetical protein